MISKTNYLQTNYLSNYELINKYSLKSVYSRPQLNKLVFKISLKSFIDSLDLDKGEDINFQLKAVLIFYILFCNLPIVNYYQFKSISKRSKGKKEGDFTIKMTVLDKYVMNNFILTLIVGNPKVFSNLVKKNRFIRHIESDKFSYSFNVKANTFKNVEDFFIKEIKNFNIKKLSISLNLLFLNFSNRGNIANTIRNSLSIV